MNDSTLVPTPYMMTRKHCAHHRAGKRREHKGSQLLRISCRARIALRGLYAGQSSERHRGREPHQHHASQNMTARSPACRSMERDGAWYGAMAIHIGGPPPRHHCHDDNGRQRTMRRANPPSSFALPRSNTRPHIKKRAHGQAGTQVHERQRRAVPGRTGCDQVRGAGHHRQHQTKTAPSAEHLAGTGVILLRQTTYTKDTMPMSATTSSSLDSRSQLPSEVRRALPDATCAAPTRSRQPPGTPAR